MTFQINHADRKPIRPPRRAERIELVQHDAKQHTLGLLRDNRVSDLASRVIDALAVAGVLSEQQLDELLKVSYRSLLRYYKLHFLDRLPSSFDLTAVGFRRRETFYTLGMVGLVIAEMRSMNGLVPISYLGYGLHRVMHDVLTNEVVIRLANAAVAQGATPLWRSKYEATVHNDDRRPILEPDALLEIGTRQLLLEYHNEDTSRRAVEKVQRYEKAYRDGHWRSSWQTDEFPLVLIAFTHRAVATGYQAAVKEAAQMGLRCRYVGKPWSSFQRGDDPALWQDFRTGEIVNVLQGGKP